MLTVPARANWVLLLVWDMLRELCGVDDRAGLRALGALALGDIGHHFPDDDPSFEGADSRRLLRQVVALASERRFALGNADLTIIAQAPKLASYIDAMRQNLADDLGCNMDQINVKATTTEKLGFVGREEGIAVHAVVFLEESPSQ